MLCWFDLTINIVCLAVLEGIKPSLHSQLGFLLVGGEHFCIKVVDIALSILTWGCLPISLTPSFGLALPAMTQFSEW